MHINIAPIAGEKGAAREVELEGDARSLHQLDPALEPLGPVHLRAKVTNIGRGYLLEGAVELPVRLTCTRCLDTFETLLSAPFSERFRRVSRGGEAADGKGGSGSDAAVQSGEFASQARASGSDADDEERSAVNSFTGDRIELDEFAREMLLLAVPMKRLCSPACKGICPQCGKNRNREACSCKPETVDPRLSRLADLLRTEDE